ncbi:MAG: hypothetical protein QOE36_3195, partial [Gaiellaceae bacterium]|nr:hypothetical protein [Gaiellaceae bacterium]
MPRLLVLTPGEFSRDPRARRAALAAVAHGWEVVAVCANVTGDRVAPVEGVEVVRVGGDRISGALRERGLGGMRTSSAPVRELRGLYRLLRLGRTTARLATAARRHGPFDVVHANDFDTLPAARLGAPGARIVYDSHELYTTQEPDPPRIFQRVAGGIERRAARRAGAVVTTGRPFADELERRLRLARPPIVVLNAPDASPSPPPAAAGGPLRVIYQAAMGPGRPLGDVIAAAAHAPGVEITLRVVGADTEEL